MDARKMKAAQNLTADIHKVAMKHGYQADFSGLSEGKGVEFRMTVSFKAPVEKSGKQLNLGSEEATTAGADGE